MKVKLKNKLLQLMQFHFVDNVVARSIAFKVPIKITSDLVAKIGDCPRCNER